MSDQRIAEFSDARDAHAFCRFKGEQDFTVCGGINMPFAVRHKAAHELATGRDEPNDYRYSAGMSEADDE